MAAGKTIGGINVTISATTAPLVKGLTFARKALVGFTRSIKNTIFSVKGLAAAFTGLAGAAGFTLMTKSAFQSIDALGELSDKLGVGTHALAGLQLAAEEAGVSQETLERALVKLSTTTGMAGDKALRAWIANTSTLTTHQQKLAAAVEMFGSRGSDMVRFLNGGVGAFDEAQRAADTFGLSLSGSVVAGVQRAMDAFGRLRKAVAGIFMQTAAALAPFVEVLSAKLTGFLTANNGVRNLGAGIADAIIRTAKVIADGIQSMVGAVMGMVDGFNGWLHGVRTSITGKAMGFGYASQDDESAAATDLRQSRQATSAFMAQKWSQGLDDLVAAARQTALRGAIAGGVANKSLTAGRGKDSLNSLVSKLAPAGLMAALQTAGDGGMLKSMFTGASAQKGIAPSLTLAESGSVESYRQQAAIRRQGADVQKKQLKRQDQMVELLRKIDQKTVVHLPMNL